MNDESATDAAVLLEAGNTFWYAGKLLDALECYWRATKALSPHEAPRLALRVRAALALALRAKGDVTAALAEYQHIRPLLDPSDPYTVTVLRQWAIAFDANREYAQARALYERIKPTSDAPAVDRLKWHHAVGLLDWSEGHFHNASTNLKIATSLMPRKAAEAAKVLAVLGNDAQVSLILEDDARAHRLVQRMLAIRARAQGVPLESEANLAITRAALAKHRNNPAREAQIYREALEWLDQNAPDESYHALDMMGRYVLALHDSGGAAEALPLLRERVAKAPATLAWVAGISLAKVEVDVGDITAARQTLGAVLAAGVGDADPEREAEIVAVLASYCARADKRDAAIFLGKLAVTYVVALVNPLPKDQSAAVLRTAKGLCDLTARVLRASGRYEEAQIVAHVFERMRQQAFSNRPPVAQTRAVDIIPMDGAEKAAQVGWMLARQRLVESRKAGDDAATLGLALQIIDLLSTFETASGLDHCYAMLPTPPAGIVRLSVVPTGQHLSLQWQTDRKQRMQPIALKNEALYSLVAEFREQLGDAQGWQQTARTLYDLIIAPLADDLRDARIFEVDSSGLLGRLPVWLLMAQCAKTPVPAVRYVTDIAARTGPHADRSGHLHVNAIATGPLAALATARVGSGSVLSGQGFTKTALFAALEAKPASLSIAAHSEIEPTRPDLSALILGDGEPLYLADIVDARVDLAGMSHVIAAACSSGQRDVTEGATLSLAGVILEKGVECFIGTLWDVPESSAADFLRAFWAKRAAFAAMDIADIVAAVQADALRRLQKQPSATGRVGGIGAVSPAGLAPHWAAFAVYTGCNQPQRCA